MSNIRPFCPWLSWRQTTQGWRAPERVVAVRGPGQGTVLQRPLAPASTSLQLGSLEPGTSYQVLFYPRGPGIAPHVGQSLYRNTHAAQISRIDRSLISESASV